MDPWVLKELLTHGHGGSKLDVDGSGNGSPSGGASEQGSRL